MGERVRIQELDPPAQELIFSLFKDRLTFARFGDVGYVMPGSYKEDADNFKNMAIRADDVWIATFPRSGTTWTQELVWLLMNDFDYDMAKKIVLEDRYYFLELAHIIHLNERSYDYLDPKLSELYLKPIPSYDEITKASSPRFIKTHLPFSLLPSKLLNTTKMVYVARDPRDVAVSFYHHNILILNYIGDFKSYWNIFIHDLAAYTPFFAHLKEAWARRHHPNMMFIFYEDMTKDLPAYVKRIANFYGKEVTDEQISKLCQHLDIKNFRQNKSVNMWYLSEINPDAESFIRKGEPGAWREHFDEEMAAQAQGWLRENLADSDLRFPDHA